MKIRYCNQQNKFKIGWQLKRMVKRAVSATLSYMEFRKDVELSVLFTDNPGIQELNALHRNIDRPTDVLSFPMFEYDEDGNIMEEFADFTKTGDLCLGDIVLSLERAQEQAEEYGHSFVREVTFLTVHSMLHLLGYDHMTPEDEEEMFGYQREILEQMGVSRNI
ncbi:MAG: rRNA maturation RNase YbeY [Clostridia bacterium]|nr:rRNA maturation RNase YbeY [Clostridia bacterium]